MNIKLTREDCIELITKKSLEINQLPKKSDFSENEVSMIKSYFGPWPRALEAAGVKEISEDYINKAEKRKQRKITSKIRKREFNQTENKE